MSSLKENPRCDDVCWHSYRGGFAKRWRESGRSPLFLSNFDTRDSFFLGRLHSRTRRHIDRRYRGETQNRLVLRHPDQTPRPPRPPRPDITNLPDQDPDRPDQPGQPDRGQKLARLSRRKRNRESSRWPYARKGRMLIARLPGICA